MMAVDMIELDSVLFYSMQDKEVHTCGWTHGHMKDNSSIDFIQK